MQWNASANAGFTTASVTPWLPVPPTSATVNVQAEEADPNSLLAWYRALIHLKKANPAFADGTDTMLDSENTKVLSWVRQRDGAPQVVVAVNFTADPQTVKLAASGAGLKAAQLKTLLKSPGGANPSSTEAIELAPFGVYIGEVQ
jgi:alpha-glucosidase